MVRWLLVVLLGLSPPISEACVRAQTPVPSAESLTIALVTETGYEKLCDTRDREVVDEVVDILNSGSRELVVFRPEYLLEIHVDDRVIAALVSGKYVKIDGISYKLDRDLGAMLGKLSDREGQPKPNGAQS